MRLPTAFLSFIFLADRCRGIRFVETDSFRGSLPVKPPPDPRALPAPYVDSSEIRGGAIGDSLLFSPQQFPPPLMYDETNAMRNTRGGAPPLPNKKKANDMRTSTYRSSSGFFSLGDIDIGAEEASRERDIEVYRNPGRVAPYTNYSGESIDLDLFDDDELGHPGSINFSALGVSDTQPSFIGNIGGPAVKTDRKYVEIRRDHHQIETSTSWEERMLAGLSALRKNQAESESESLSETSTAWEDRMLARETLSALPKNQEESESETSTAWEDRMLAREAGGRLTAVGTRRKEEDEEQEDEQRKELKGWASKMLQREFAAGKNDRGGSHPPVREYSSGPPSRDFDPEPLSSMTPSPSVEKKYAKPPLREFSSPPRDFSLAPNKFSLPPKEFSPAPNIFNNFGSERGRFNSEAETFNPTPNAPTSLFMNQNNVNFGLLISSGEGGGRTDCQGPARQKLIRGLKSILRTEIHEDDEMFRRTGVRLGLTVADECLSSERERLVESFILLTNSENTSTMASLPPTDPRVLNVSRGQQLDQFTKALGKVGIRRYHTLTREEVYTTSSLMANLDQKEVDTVIADVHGSDLEVLVERLSGLPEAASRYSWIFTSLLSSDMLVQIEQLLARTRVLSIFPVKNRKLLRATVKLKDNAAQVLAMETALPYLHMLRQLREAYTEAWNSLCGGSRGICPRLSRLQPAAFLRQFFHPGLEARRHSPASYMLIVYKSSSAEDFLDVEIPEATPTTVRAVVSTVNSAGSKPHLVITETLSTIDIEHMDERLSTSGTTEEILDELTAFSTTEVIVAEATASTTIRVATTESAESTEEPESLEDRVAFDLEKAMVVEREKGPLAVCEEYNACVVYLIEDDESRRAAWFESLLRAEEGPARRNGLSLGSALVSHRELEMLPLPSNLVATVTLDNLVDDFVHSQVHNFNINEIAQSLPSEDSVVPVVSRVLGEMIDTFGWSSVLLVYFNDGVTRQVAEELMSSGKACVTELVHLQLNYLESQAYNRLLLGYSVGGTKVILVAESPDQVVYLMENIAEELGWDPIKATEQVAWAFLQTSGSLAQLSEDLPNMPLYILAESSSACDYCVDEEEAAVAKGVRGVMQNVRSALSLFSPDCRQSGLKDKSCLQELRGHLTESHQNAINFNILRLNPERIEDPDETLFVLAGEFQDRSLTLYEGPMSSSVENSDAKICFNSTNDVHYQLQLRASTGSHLQSLWGSIALGLSIFGILIVSISGIYFIFTVNRKQKTEYGSVKDPTRLLHYMMILGLVLLFCSPIPFLLRLSSLTCALRAALPGVAFSIVLSSLLVNLVSTWRKNIYTVNPAAHQASHCLCSPTSESPQGLLFTAVLLSAVQATITTVGIAVRPPVPQLLDGHWRCDPGESFEEGMVLLHGWLLLLTIAVLAMAVACLKYCATNRDAKWSLVSVIALVTVWAAWFALVRLLDFRYKDPVCVMALVVSALIVLLCIYARKLYEFTEFGKADTKLELMSNILLSESPTNSQPSYGTNILPHTIAMPEFEDNSILGESLYQHVNNSGRTYNADRGPVDLSMFEHEFPPSSDENEMASEEGGSMPDISGDRSLRDRDYNPEQIYHSISRGVSYKPMLKKIGTRKMLVLPNQHTLTHGSTSKI